jgi:DNA modification methylase
MQLYNADCLEILPKLADNTFHALVTDPPAGIGFMGMAFDSDRGGKREWIAWLSSVMKECLRVMRPGAHTLVWALPRTSHWTADAIEDAGFEIRDCVYHLFGQGFPHGLDVSKAIDKRLGAERERLRGVRSGVVKDTYAHDAWSLTHKDSVLSPDPLTVEARTWQGWSTALKPACELWILARKPLSERSVADNVLKWGTGALNIEGCKVGTERHWSSHERTSKVCYGNYNADCKGVWKQGRYPANLICSEPDFLGEHARFFYCPKASRAERDSGCEHLPAKTSGYRPNDPDENTIRQRLHGSIPAANNHPTIKPLALMRYLCRMVTPVGGMVLDPFCGSGSTGVAALQEGFDFVGIEKEKGYFDIATTRIAPCQAS